MLARTLTAALAIALMATPITQAQSPGQAAMNEAAAPEASPEAQRLQQLYMGFLAKEGYQPTVDSDGDVQFKAEGKTYFIDVNEKDLMYFNLVLPNIWPIESEPERAQVLAAADAANRTCKATKVFMVRDNVWIGIELFVETPEDFVKVFKRSMTGIQCGVKTFVETMRGE